MIEPDLHIARLDQRIRDCQGLVVARERHMVTFATDRRGGFDDAHIDRLSELLPPLALVSEIRMKNRLARTLLETYVGSHASELVLAGATRRGSGTTVRAAIMICDLRDFTRISDNWPREDVIDLLNGYFDAMSGPIARHGGEIPEIHRRRPARHFSA
jgi:adenylate cyclase